MKMQLRSATGVRQKSRDSTDSPEDADVSPGPVEREDEELSREREEKGGYYSIRIKTGAHLSEGCVHIL
jgi:hypothetical protein